MKRNLVVEVLGLISGTLTAYSFLPGVIAVWKTRPAPATIIPFGMYIPLCVGLAGWFMGFS